MTPIATPRRLENTKVAGYLRIQTLFMDVMIDTWGEEASRKYSLRQDNSEIEAPLQL